MPVALNDFINTINTNLNISELSDYLTPRDKTFIETLCKENVVVLLDIINQILLIEANGVVRPTDILNILLLVDKAVKQLIWLKRAVSVKHLNIIRFLMETLAFNLLKFSTGVSNDDIRKVVSTSLEILQTSPKLKTTWRKIFFLSS